MLVGKFMVASPNPEAAMLAAGAAENSARSHPTAIARFRKKIF